MPLGYLAEALARVEHKLDQLLKFVGAITTPMHFPGQDCPVCHKVIDYQIDIIKNVVTRRCGCSTGKQPMAQLIQPVGGTNGKSVSNSNSRNDTGEAEADTEHGDIRKIR